MGPEDLTAALNFLMPPTESDSRILVGTETHDDAGVFLLSETQALVQTVDFMTPVVDDPYIFGQIVATNSLSDIYAMGANPLTALNLLAVPDGVLTPEAIGQMLQGGQSVLHHAGTALLGGHSIDDPEPKMGYAVTGTVHPDRIWRNSTAQPGDVLFLSKAIGTGVIIKAIKDGLADPAMTQSAIAMMLTSNRMAKEALETACQPTAVTDVTGFGLLGHAWEMALGSQMSFHINAGSVPLLPGSLDLARDDRFPAGSRRNLDYVRPYLDVTAIDEAHLALLADAVTSGGLLFTVSASSAERVRTAFEARTLPLYAIGHVAAAPSPGIILRG